MKMAKIGFLGSIKKFFKSVPRGYQIPPWTLNYDYKPPIYQSEAWQTSKRLRESAWTTACIQRYQFSCSSVKFVCQQWSEDVGDYVHAVDHPVEQLLDRPNGYQPSATFISLIITNLLKDGNCFISIKDSRTLRKTTSLEVLHTDGVRPVLDPVDLITGYNVTQTVPSLGGITKETRFVKKKDMIHIMLPNSENPEWGISPLESIKDVQDGEALALEWHKALMENWGRPAFGLTTKEPLAPNQIAKIQQAFYDYGSVDRMGYPPVFTHDIKPTTLGLSPVQMDVVEIARLDAERICAVMGVPPAIIGQSKNATLANLREYIKFFWSNSVMPLLEIICQAITHHWIQPRFGDSFRLQVDTSNVNELKDDQETKVNIATKLFQLGYSMNELNRVLELGLPEGDAGDIRCIQGNIIDIGDGEIMIPSQVGPTQPNNGDVPEYTEGDEQFRAGQQPRTNLPTTKPPTKSRRHRREVKADPRLDAIWRATELDRKTFAGIYRARVTRLLYENLQSLSNLPVRNLNQSDLVSWSAEAKVGWARMLKSVWVETANYFLKTFDERNQVRNKSQKVEALSPSEAELLNLIVISRADYVVDTTSHYIIDFVNKSLAQGLSEADITTSLKARIPSLTDFRAAVIVENEVLAAGNYGNRLGAVKSGEYTLKTWRTRRDTLVRDLHVRMEGESTALSGYYSNGLMFPCDPSGPPEQVINCRCFESYA
jgi:HK97 family phage portal protein